MIHTPDVDGAVATKRKGEYDLKNEIIVNHCFTEIVCLLVAAPLLYSFCITISVWFLMAFLAAVAVLTYMNIKMAIWEYQDNIIEFCMIEPDAVMPSKESEDAGYDIYACFKEDYMEIAPGETRMIPTGIASSFNKKYVAVLKERGSTGTKGMGQRCGIIDSSFRGEWFVPITNHNRDRSIIIIKDDFKEEFIQDLENNGTYDCDDFIFYSYEKGICQALILPVPKVEVKKVSKRKLNERISKRGTGALGSSGK